MSASEKMTGYNGCRKQPLRKAGFSRGYVKTQLRPVFGGAKTIVGLEQIEYGAF
jgi:hypothetical protein